MTRNRHMRRSAVTLRRREMRKDIKAQIKTIRSKTVVDLLGNEKVQKSVTPMQSTVTVLGLRAKAKDLGVVGFSKMKKADLLAAIAAKEAQ